jgi:hypothetical protein
MNLGGNIDNIRMSSFDREDGHRSHKLKFCDVIWSAIGAAVAIGLAL